MQQLGSFKRIHYTEDDLQEAAEEVRRIQADSDFRGQSPGRYRGALAAAKARRDTIAGSLSDPLLLR